MTVAQALVTFLGHQWTVDGDHRERTIAGVIGIFGHGNVAGLGQALKQAHVQDPDFMPYYQARNEQAMVHEAVGYARMRRRLSTFASAASVGPGAANMVTGAAVATSNRLPALILPADTFATRVAEPVLQQLEHPHDPGIQVTDAFRPVSRFFDRVNRPEQLFSIALGAMRVLTDPVETGAVTIALPQDVQTEALDVPLAFLADREWHLRRPLPEPDALARAAAAIRGSQRPFLVVGGGVLYAGAEQVLQQFAAATGIPVGATQAGVGSLAWDDPHYLGGVGATGTTAANRLVAEADLVIGIGTRYSDFTTASRAAFQNPEVRFVNVNVAPLDAVKHGASVSLVADAREALVALLHELDGFRVATSYSAQIQREKAAWDARVDAAFAGAAPPAPEAVSSTASTGVSSTGAEAAVPVPSQTELLGALQEASDPTDVVVQAAGSLPGDLHKLWRVRDPLGYHVEYAFSCMGYEIAGGLGVRRAAPDRDVLVLVGDGSYLMLHTELVTAVAEQIKIIVVIVQNHGFASIGNLSDRIGNERFGTWYRRYDAATRDFQGPEILPIDLAANARSYGVPVIEVEPGPSWRAEVVDAVRTAKAATGPTVIHIQTDPLAPSPDGDGWWDVPVAEVAGLDSTRTARAAYDVERERQRPLLG